MTATVDQATAASRNLHSSEAQFKNGFTRIGKAFESAGEEEKAAMRAELLAMLDGGEGDLIAPPDDSKAIEILARQEPNDRDYDAMLRSFQEQAKVAEEQQARAGSDTERQHHARRIKNLNYFAKLTEAAKEIPAEPRTFGCRRLPRNLISGRDTGFPDIQFKYHTYTTSDPLEIARLLDYMTNPSAGDATIEALNAGEVAIISHDTGQVVMFENGLRANDIIASSSNQFRRPFR